MNWGELALAGCLLLLVIGLRWADRDLEDDRPTIHMPGTYQWLREFTKRRKNGGGIKRGD